MADVGEELAPAGLRGGLRLERRRQLGRTRRDLVLERDPRLALTIAVRRQLLRHDIHPASDIAELVLPVERDAMGEIACTKRRRAFDQRPQRAAERTPERRSEDESRDDEQRVVAIQEERSAASEESVWALFSRKAVSSRARLSASSARRSRPSALSKRSLAIVQAERVSRPGVGWLRLESPRPS